MRVHTDQAVIDAVVRRVGEAGVGKDSIHAQDGGLPVAKCTALISVPSVKVHTLTGIAVAMKNYINFSPAPSKYHAPARAWARSSFCRTSRGRRGSSWLIF